MHLKRLPSTGSSHHEAFLQQPYFGSLDGLRGIAILLVLLHHLSRFESPALEVLRENGRYGVSLFFAISGFLIATLLLRERRLNGRIAVGRFFARRALRLLPLYYLVLALHVVLILGLGFYSAEHRQLFADKLASYLFYYSNWVEGPAACPFFCAWSLAAEEQFYLVFALLFVLVPPRLLPAVVAAALGLKFLIYQTIGFVDVFSAVGRVVFSYQEPILLGVLLAFALERRPVYDAFARLSRSPVILPALAVLIGAWLALHPMRHGSTWDAQSLYLAMTLLLGVLVVRPPAHWLTHGLLAHTGRVSYGIYLLHMLVISAGRKLLPEVPLILVLLGSVVLSVVLATLSHRLLEAPFIAYAKRRFAPTAAKAAPVAVPLPRPA